MTCLSLCSVNVDPPTLLVCLRAQSPTLVAILRCGTFATNLLHGELAVSRSCSRHRSTAGSAG